MPMEMEAATTEMAMQIPVLRNEKIKKRMVEIDVGYVSFTLVFQEVCDYSLNFVNWGGRLLRKYLPNEIKSKNNPFVEVSLKNHSRFSSIIPVQTVKSKPETIVSFLQARRDCVARRDGRGRTGAARWAQRERRAQIWGWEYFLGNLWLGLF